MEPNSIDHHSCGERIVRAGNLLCKLKPATACFERLSLAVGQNLEELPGNFRPWVAGVAAYKNHGLDRRGTILQHHGTRRSTSMRGIELVDFPPQGAHLLLGGCVEQAVHLLRIHAERRATRV